MEKDPKKQELDTVIEEKKPGWAESIGTTLIIGTAGAAVLALVGAGLTPTMGATRSRRLQWEERQAAIREVMVQQEEEVPSPPISPEQGK